jgi:hypothetical protein
MGIYVGRNEGNPPEVIDTALRALIATLHPGLHYISNSAMGVVSGGAHTMLFLSETIFFCTALTSFTVNGECPML